MRLRFIGIFTGVLFIYGLLTAFIGWNGWLLLSALTGWHNPIPYTIVVAIVALAYVLGRLGQSTLAKPVAEPLKLIGAYWFALFQYGLLVLPVADLASLLLRWGGASPEVYKLGVGCLTAVLLIGLMVKGSWNAWQPIIRRYEASVSKPAGNLGKLRIAMASDLHLGTVVGNRHVERLLDKINEIKPDIILLAGDILDDDIDPFIRKNMSATLGKLKAPLGVYAVTGNHEYIGGKVPEFVAAMDAIGIRVLMDEATLIADSFIVLGRKDRAAGGRGANGRKTIEQLLEPLDRSKPLIMMDHQPSELLAASGAGVDVSLSGHTHRGQMAPNHLITRRMFPLDWGYRKFGQLHAFVSSGFGFWGPPVRIGSRAEVLHIELTFSPQI